MEVENTKLTVKLNGKDVTIDVLDIVENPQTNKEYIVYTIDGLSKDEIFASVLNEKEDSYSLDTVETEDEMNFVNNKISELVEAMKDDEDGTGAK